MTKNLLDFPVDCVECQDQWLKGLNFVTNTVPQDSKYWRFCFILPDIANFTKAEVHSIMFYTKDDANLTYRNGVIHIWFEREASNLKEAIRTAARDLICAGVPLSPATMIYC